TTIADERGVDQVGLKLDDRFPLYELVGPSRKLVERLKERARRALGRIVGHWTGRPFVIGGDVVNRGPLIVKNVGEGVFTSHDQTSHFALGS
ncbi:hypothetical protein, partial [Bradyrhizobium diazoefficiens]|uniref:hypothetical protein n=1 Tax=Bradyrhizobium diazoefficiens TaxID=1355477 RepID=UPI00383395B3